MISQKIRGEISITEIISKRLVSVCIKNFSKSKQCKQWKRGWKQERANYNQENINSQWTYEDILNLSSIQGNEFDLNRLAKAQSVISKE